MIVPVRSITRIDCRFESRSMCVGCQSGGLLMSTPGRIGKIRRFLMSTFQLPSGFCVVPETITRRIGTP